MKKWRNKITGEINEFMVHKRIEDSEDGNPVYAPFNGNIDEWEDYEEPKEYWYIDWNGEAGRSDIHDERTEQMKLIGNYFESKEEAEKAVEKLKALTKLCKKGFEFNSIEMFGSGLIRIEASIPINEKTTLQERSNITDNLYLLFGGEE